LTRAARPWLADVVGDALRVEDGGDLYFRLMLNDEEVVDAVHCSEFVVWPWGEDDALGLEALAFSPGEGGLGLPVLVQEESPQAVTGGAALSAAERDETALAAT
jgi:hypothetical protein